MNKPTPEDIARFRHGIKEHLQSATGYFYFCSDVMNKLLKEVEGLSDDSPVVYCVLMCKKQVPPIPDAEVSDQRNIFFRYDLQNNIFYMQRTDAAPENQEGVTAFEYEVYFFPQALFISVEDDYPALESWLAGGTAPQTSLRVADGHLAQFVNDNDGRQFVLTIGHTRPLRK